MVRLACSLALLCAGIALPARAQQDSARVPPPDSVAVGTQAPSAVVSGGSGVVAVRQRIRAIRGMPQRIVQPIVVVAAPASATEAPAAGLPSLTAEERQAIDRIRPGLADRLQVYIESARPPVVVNLLPDAPGTPVVRDSTTQRDSVAVPGGITPPPRPSGVQPLPRVPVASVREVERAILETGLFRAVGINFEFDRSTLLEGSEAVLEPVGEVLRRYPNLTIEVGGHTDDVGSAAYNERLSQARAETVRTYLITHFGLDPARLVARGYGESRPFVTNANPTGRTLNRRVEFAVLTR